MVERVVIIGASLAGIRCVGSLRQSGFTGRITLIGDEAHRPYDRPPLSKQFLSGEWDEERVGLVKPDAWDALDCEFVASRRAVSLDTPSKTVTLDDGAVVSGDALVIATGARPRTLAGVELRGVHVLRSLDDARALRDDLAGSPKRVVIIGCGFVGSEVAATAQQLGHAVAIIEGADVPMERGLGPTIGAFCGELHRDHGVDLRLSTGVSGIRGHTVVDAVELDDGSVVDADVVVVGIGVVPNTEWLNGSGLTIDDGVVANEYCEASDGIYVAGDVARWKNVGFGGEVMRVEHWENASEQGRYVGRRIAGSETAPFSPVPWFWSDQYGNKIHMAGRPRGSDEMNVVIGAMADQRFVALFGRDGMLTGVFGMNRPKQVMQFRMQIAQGATWDDALAYGAQLAAKLA